MSNKNYCVYMHKNKINQKVYIGITGQLPEKRWNNGKGYLNQSYFGYAIQKYGWDNFEHIILYNNLTKKEAEELEIKIIALYDSTNQNNGYNIQRGGYLGSSKEVYQYDRLSGDFIKKWENVIDIERTLNIPNADISAVCLGKVKTAHNYYFSYNDFGYNLPNDIYDWINTNDCKVKIAQYDKYGNFIAIHNSIVEAVVSIGLDENKRMHFKRLSYGFIWKKIDDSNIDYTKNLTLDELKLYENHVNSIKCYMYDKNGMFIKEFSSTTEASNETNINQSNIAAACRGEYSSAGNYFWKYAYDIEHGVNLSENEIEILNTHGLSKKVYQFDLNGNYIKSYKNITIAAEENHTATTNISKVCNRKLKQTGGYIWRYNIDDINDEDIKEINTNNRHKRVNQYDMNMNYIDTYKSIAEASRKTKTSASSITQCCNNKYKHANNYIWKYVD